MTYTTGRETGTWAPTNATESPAGTSPGFPTGTPTGAPTEDGRAKDGRTKGHGAGTPGTPTGTGTRTGAGTGTGTGTGAHTADHLLPQDECERLALRMQQAVAGFVDAPQGAVQEADQVLEDIAARFTEAMTKRRRGLRSSWQPDGTHGTGATGGATGGDTEQLRLALRDYRELAERLLRT